MPSTTSKNTLFSYLYRNGNNFKDYGEVVFQDAPTEELLQRLVSGLYDGGYFYHGQLDLRNLATWRAAGWKECFPTVDHVWHEFYELEATSREPTDERTIEEFVSEVEAIGPEGWQTPSFIEELGGLSALQVYLSQSTDPAHEVAQRFSLSYLAKEERFDLLTVLADTLGADLPEVWRDYEKVLDSDLCARLLESCEPEARRALYKMSQHLSSPPSNNKEQNPTRGRS